MGVLILNSGRCSHGRCFFCGYGRIRGNEPTPEKVDECFDRFFSQLSDNEVKVYGSGSFLDERQVPVESRAHFIRLCKDKNVGYVQIESRPEYITADVLSEFKGLDMAVAIGLESADNQLLNEINKGFTVEEFEDAAKTIHDVGFKVRAYLLVNPPFTNDIDRQLRESVEYALKHADKIVLINTLPHSNAPLMRLWVAGEWNFLTKQEFHDLVAEYEEDERVEVEVETFRFTPSFSEQMREKLDGVGETYLTHPHYEVWHDYIIRWYTPPEGRTLLFLPCSFRKPYSQSKTHHKIINVLKEEGGFGRFHEVMLSSAGVIPREFENKYPFNSYDWSEKEETPEIKKRYIQVTGERIRNYLTAHMKYYKHVVCYLKYSSESYQALESVCRELGVPLRNLLTQETYEAVQGESSPLQTDEAVGDLREGVKWCLRNSM